MFTPTDRDDQDFAAAMELHRRRISDETMRKFEDYMAEIFTAFGLDLHTPATEETPHRFIRAMFDVTAGYDGDPKVLKVFEKECHGGSDCAVSQIIEGPIDFFALCEHHALPFHGHAYVGYIAHEHIGGDAGAARRRGVSRGSPPLYPDARCSRDLPADPDDVLAWGV